MLQTSSVVFIFDHVCFVDFPLKRLGFFGGVMTCAIVVCPAYYGVLHNGLSPPRNFYVGRNGVGFELTKFGYFLYVLPQTSSSAAKKPRKRQARG